MVISYNISQATFGSIVTSTPQSHLGKTHRQHLRQRMHSPTSCATSCAMTTARVQSLSCGYATSIPQYHMHRIRYIALFDSPPFPPPKKKFAPSLTGDINPQSSLEQWKMKIAHNSANVQTETLNFTFTRQGAVVYFYLCSNFQEIVMPNVKY